MESNIKNGLIEDSSFLEEINPQTTSECTIEFKKAERRSLEGAIAMGKIAHIYKTKFKKTREEFVLWCEKELLIKEVTANKLIRNYEVFAGNAISYNNLCKNISLNKIEIITSLCENELTKFEDGKELRYFKIDRDEENRRKFNTYHMDNFTEQYKDSLEDITLQELRELVKDYKITNDLIKEKKQELKESEQKLIDTYKELETVSAETDKIKYVQSTIGNIVTSSNKLDILFEDDYKPIIQDVDMKKELEVNLIHIRDKINNLLNEINLEKYNCGNIIDIENYTTEG